MQDHLRAVASWQTSDTTTRMRAGAAKIESAHTCAVVAVTQQRTRGPQLIETKSAMKDVAGRQSETLFEIERREREDAEDAAAEVGCVARDGVDDEVRGALPFFFPAAAIGERGCEVLAEQARHMRARRRERIIQRARYQHLDHRFARHAMQARVQVGA